MKKQFSTSWKASKQIRKQRKFRANAPIGLKRQMIVSTLSKELRQKYNRRSFALKKGDTVIIMRGEFKKKTGKIGSINLQKMKVILEGIQMDKKDGTKANVLFDPSNLKITELNIEDKKRIEAIKKENIKDKNKSGEKKNAS